MTTKPRARTAANRGPAPFNDRPDGKLEEIVSVRFSTEELRRIQAYATILEMTPNGVIREACSFFLASKVGGPDYLKAVEAYLMPLGVEVTQPEGGMHIWARREAAPDSWALFDRP